MLLRIVTIFIVVPLLGGCFQEELTREKAAEILTKEDLGIITILVASEEVHLDKMFRKTNSLEHNELLDQFTRYFNYKRDVNSPDELVVIKDEIADTTYDLRYKLTKQKVVQMLNNYNIFGRLYELGVYEEILVSSLNVKEGGVNYLDISIKPTLSANIRCEEASSGENCAVKVAEWKLDEVTGITGEGIERLVEYKVTIEPTELGVAFEVAKATELKTEERKAKFALYDDGWRVTKLGVD